MIDFRQRGYSTNKNPTQIFNSCAESLPRRWDRSGLPRAICCHWLTAGFRTLLSRDEGLVAGPLATPECDPWRKFRASAIGGVNVVDGFHINNRALSSKLANSCAKVTLLPENIRQVFTMLQ